VSGLSTGIGETLRTARRRQGRSLADVAASTRVRESHLAAIESEEFDALGGDVYVRGFITAYARFLGLDPGPLLDAHRHYRDGQEHDRGHRQHWGTPSRPAGVRVRSARAAVLLVLAIVVTVALVVVGLAAEGEAAARVAAGWS
jgi:cytoskeleton protein RodZ